MSWDRERIVGLLIEAGEIAKRARKDLRRDWKPDRSIVTQADREIEAMFASALERPAPPGQPARPGRSVPPGQPARQGQPAGLAEPHAGTYLIGEETVSTRGEDYFEKAFAAETFVVDPIDGTVPYAYGMPNWGVSIGRMEKGVLTDGAVYLVDFGEIVLTEGGRVLEGVCAGAREGRGPAGGPPARWSWRELPAPEMRPEMRSDLRPDRQPEMRAGDLPVALTQEVAKRGRVDIANPVMVLGAAVVPMVGLVQGRVGAYFGSVKLWDVGGSLPLVLRHGFSATVSVGGERRAVTARVEDSTYDLTPGSPTRWALRSDLVICPPADEARFVAAFCANAGEGGGE